MWKWAEKLERSGGRRRREWKIRNTEAGLCEVSEGPSGCWKRRHWVDFEPNYIILAGFSFFPFLFVYSVWLAGKWWKMFGWNGLFRLSIICGSVWAFIKSVVDYSSSFFLLIYLPSIWEKIGKIQKLGLIHQELAFHHGNQ